MTTLEIQNFRLNRRALLKISAHASTAAAAYLGGLTTTGCNRNPADMSLPFGVDKDRLFRSLLEGYSGYEVGVDFDHAVFDGACEVIDLMRRTIEAELPALFDDLNLALCALEWAPVASGYFSRFSSLSFTEREAFLLNWILSSTDFKVEIAYGLRPLFLLALYEQDEVKARVNYDKPILDRKRAKHG